MVSIWAPGVHNHLGAKMKRSHFLALVLSLLIVPNVYSQGTNTYFAQRPATGDNAGEIKVSGTVKPDAGWTPTGSGFILVWPTGGGSTKNAGINVDPKTGNWHFVNNKWVDAIAGGLTSGKEYWCVVICNVQMGGNQASLATDAAKVTAK